MYGAFDCMFLSCRVHVYGLWSEIIVGLSQGSILESLLSNIFLNYLFLYAKEKPLSDCTSNNANCRQLAIQWIKVKKATVLESLETGFTKT